MSKPDRAPYRYAHRPPTRAAGVTDMTKPACTIHTHRTVEAAVACANGGDPVAATRAVEQAMVESANGRPYDEVAAIEAAYDAWVAEGERQAAEVADATEEWEAERYTPEPVLHENPVTGWHDEVVKGDLNYL